jgi:hypothetical protein
MILLNVLKVPYNVYEEVSITVNNFGGVRRDVLSLPVDDGGLNLTQLLKRLLSAYSVRPAPRIKITRQ